MRLIPLMLWALVCSSGAAQFRLVQWGDLHAFHTQGGNATNHDAAVQWCLTNDVAAVIWTGDCYEQGTNYLVSSGTYGADAWTVSDVTNAAASLVAAGIQVWACDGNHDADDTESTNAAGGLYAGCWPVQGAEWTWTNFFPLSFFSAQVGYVTGYVDGAVQQIAMSYTNDGVKLLWCNYDSSIPQGASGLVEIARQTQWIVDVASLFPGHNLIVTAHYLVSGRDESGVPSADQYYARLSTDDISGGPVQYLSHGVGPHPWTNGLESVPNLLLCLSGHTRSLSKGHVGVLSGGFIVDVQCFNMQQGGYSGPQDPNGTLINVLTVDTRERLVTVETVDVFTQASLENYTADLWSAVGLNVVHPHNWSLPLRLPSPRGRWKPR